MAPNLIRLSDSVEKAMYSRIHQCESEYSVIGSDLGSSKTEIYSLSDQDTASLSSFQGKVENEADKVSVSEQWCEDIPWCESTNGKNCEKLGEFYNRNLLLLPAFSEFLDLHLDNPQGFYLFGHAELLFLHFNFLLTQKSSSLRIVIVISLILQI